MNGRGADRMAAHAAGAAVKVEGTTVVEADIVRRRPDSLLNPESGPIGPVDSLSVVADNDSEHVAANADVELQVPQRERDTAPRPAPSRAALDSPRRTPAESGDAARGREAGRSPKNHERAISKASSMPSTRQFVSKEVLEAFNESCDVSSKSLDRAKSRDAGPVKGSAKRQQVMNWMKASQSHKIKTDGAQEQQVIEFHGQRLLYPLRHVVDQMTVLEDSAFEEDDMTVDEMSLRATSVEEDTDHVVQAARRANLVLVLHGGLVLGVALLDVTTFFVLHVLLPEMDFMCKLSRGDNNLWYFTGVMRPRVMLISVTIAMYLVILITRVLVLKKGHIGMIFDWRRSKGFKLITLFSIFFLVTHSQTCFGELKMDAMQFQEHAWSRLHMTMHFIRMLFMIQTISSLKSDFTKVLQTAISMNKRRFIENHVNLDLTYICDRMIAMALPCVADAVYRNDIRDVSSFFASRHYGKFLVFNCCEEHEESCNGNYDSSLLYGQVWKLPFHDHHAPQLHVLIGFLEKAAGWLNKTPENIVAVHCLGGKGRTGTLCASLMLWTDFLPTTYEACHYFKHRRTDRRRGAHPLQGVDAPSQLRYIQYVEDIVLRGMDYVSFKPLALTALIVHTLPMPTRDRYFLSFIVCVGSRIEYDHGKAKGLVKVQRDAYSQPSVAQLSFDVGHVLLLRDTCVRFFIFEEELQDPQEESLVAESRWCDNTRGKLGPGAVSLQYGNITGKQLFFMQFHTSFVTDSQVENGYRFEKSQIDGAYSKEESKFCSSFAVTLKFNKDLHELHSPKLRSVHKKSSSPNLKMNSDTCNSSTPDRGQTAKTLLKIPELPKAVEDPSTSAVGAEPGVQGRGERFIIKMYEVAQLFERACPVPVVYEKGEIIYDAGTPFDDTQRNLYFISSGFARWEMVDGQQPFGGPVEAKFFYEGIGDMFCASTFLKGNSSVCPGEVLRVYSERIEVREISVQCLGTGVPVHCDGLAPMEVALLYEALARSISSRTQDISMHVWTLSSSAHPKTAALADEAGNRNAEVMARHVKKALKLNAADQLHGAHPASLVSDNSGNTKAGQPGQIFVFSTCIVFTPDQAIQSFMSRKKKAADGDTTLVIMYKDVVSLEVAANNTLILGTMCNDDDESAHECPLEKSMSFTSKPTVTESMLFWWRGIISGVMQAKLVGGGSESPLNNSRVPLQPNKDLASFRLNQRSLRRMIPVSMVSTPNTERGSQILEAGAKMRKGASMIVAEEGKHLMRLIFKMNSHGAALDLRKQLRERCREIDTWHGDNLVKGNKEHPWSPCRGSASLPRGSTTTPTQQLGNVSPMSPFRRRASPGRSRPTLELPPCSPAGKDHGLGALLKFPVPGQGGGNSSPEGVSTPMEASSPHPGRDTEGGGSSAKSVATASNINAAGPATYCNFGYTLADAEEEDDAEFMELFFKTLVSRTYKRNDVLLHFGSTRHSALYHIVSGEVVVISDSGRVLADLGAGAMLGEASFLDTGNRGANANVVASEETMVLLLGREHVKILCEQEAAFGARVYRSLALSALRQWEGRMKAMYDWNWSKLQPS